MTKNILSEIVATKRKEVDMIKRILPESVLLDSIATTGYKPVSMKRAIVNSETGIIAECKRRSPSCGEINAQADVSDIIAGYVKNGAAACSVLTDTVYFGGSLSDLAVARSVASVPLLRKDFTIDNYQIVQARAFGADAILLIASILSRKEIAQFTDLAHSLNLEVLLELHNVQDFQKIDNAVDIVGINNRDLTSFSTNIDNSRKLVEKLPANIVKIAESGIKTLYDVLQLREAGFNGFLIGETFMRKANPPEALREFL